MLRLLLVVLLALVSMTASAQLKIGDFVLGMPQAQVIHLLEQQFGTVVPVSESRYQIPVQLVSATNPKENYQIQGFRVNRVNVFFNDHDLLNQFELILDTVDLDKVKMMIPYVERAQLEPLFKNSWEIIVDEGEIVYFTGSLSDTTQIIVADKPTSIKNIDARRQSTLRFKGMADKVDHMINVLKDQQRGSEN